jgi:prevent-host-death family protein
MITVGVRDLKNQLSHYLQYVKKGEKVIITEHSKVIAEISLPENDKKLTEIEEKLINLSKEGDIVLAKRNRSCVKLPDLKEKLDWEAVYNEIRKDRI